ncbi:hypothetical protein Amet_1596 [Alkaliphilus metalliredigens QYMF]|uniref:Transposase n=1 Tax=Alkaliphilus metalliredigens (strain QYMF) TaxID=293826 RepID=A6TNK7_ALKMQ|nr:DUF6262 family protein [Alkaliphilus metalliredigens]ABR47775.1 hypothetical protein Amet_1596 [Alkaliphilus metalliredigens QYMF]
MKGSKHIRNTKSIVKMKKAENEQTIKDVNLVIDNMKCQRRSINFATVAEQANVSRGTLYNNDILKERIISLRTMERATKKGCSIEDIIIKPSNRVLEQDKKIKALCEEIRELKQKQEKLIFQLVEMKEIKAENKWLGERIKELEYIEKSVSSLK